MINNRPNFKNNSQAFVYATYMMVGSYFQKCVCANAMKEDKLYVAYCEAGNKLQYKLEEQAERYARKNLLVNDFDTSIFNYEVEVYFREMPDGIDIVFYGGFFRLDIYCAVNEGQRIIRHAFFLYDGTEEADANGHQDRKQLAPAA